MTIYQPKSNEKEISFCVQAAIEKLDGVDADAKEKKTQIVQDLAKDLEGKISTDSICNEIVHQLQGKVSERLIRSCLDEKYKDNRRVENAKKQKKKHQSTEELAATVPLNNRQEEKKIVIYTSGKEVAEPQPYIIKGSDDNDKEMIAQSNRRADAELMLTHSLNGEITSVSREKENLTDKQKEVLISHIPIRFEDLRKDMATVFQITKGVGNVFFKIWVDLGTHVVRIKFCGITQENGIPMTSTGEGRMLKETN